MKPRVCDLSWYRALLPGIILILCIAILVMSADAAAPARGVPTPATTTATASPFPVRTAVGTTAQQTVACGAPCSCMERPAAIAAWGADGFTRCAELPCGYGVTATGLPVEKNCFRQKAAAVISTLQPTTPPVLTQVQLPVATTLPLVQANPPDKKPPLAGVTFKAPENLCGGDLVDLDTDPDNCGMCGRQCEAGNHEVCKGGICTCGQDMLLCDIASGCTDVMSDPNRCGSCGNVCPQGQTCFTGHCQEPYLKLLFIPLNWKGDQAGFDTAVDEQVKAFVDGIPLKNCPHQIGATKLSVTIQDNNPWAWGVDVRTYAAGLGIDIDAYDVIVGFSQTSPSPPIDGISNMVDTIWVTKSSGIVTAHELGHIYGLEDEYCSNPAGSTDCRCNDGDLPSPGCGTAAGNDGAATGDRNWLDSSLGCDEFGTSCCNDHPSYQCVAVNYGPCCLGNKNPPGGRCTMSFTNAPGPRSFCQHCKDWLATVPALQCHSPPLPLNRTIVDVSLAIHADDTVTGDALILTDGRPTADYHIGTGYELRVLDARGGIVMNRKFDVFFDYTGPVQRGVDYSSVKFAEVPFSYRIPYNSSMQTLRIYHGNKMIYAKELDFCNRDGSCGATETFRTCPADCPLDQKDKICTPVRDFVCDPDCRTSIDPDCRTVHSALWILGAGIIVVCTGAVGWYFMGKKKGSG